MLELMSNYTNKNSSPQPKAQTNMQESQTQVLNDLMELSIDLKRKIFELDKNIKRLKTQFGAVVLR